MSWLKTFAGSSIGKKLMMAGSGILLLLFLLVHLLGNLQIFIGADALNAYAHFLHSKPAVVWIFRLIVAALFVVHIVTSIVLWLENKAARPVAYHKKDTLEATLASRTMIYSGIVMVLFLVYHLLHLTAHSVGPELHQVHGGPDVFRAVVDGFSAEVWWIPLIYIVAQVFLFLHLTHAFQSAFQTLGLNHARYTPLILAVGWIYAAVIALGNILIPVAVLAGWVC